MRQVLWLGGLMTLLAACQLERPYVGDAEHATEVARATLPEMAEAAGVPIGAAVPSSEEGLREYVPSDFNQVVAENAMKWNKLLRSESTLGEYDFTEADAFVDYARSVGARVRGHTLVWGRFLGRSYPHVAKTQIEAAGDPAARAREILREHIEAVASHFDGRVAVWDVVNEHLSSRHKKNVFFEVLGDDYVREAFEMTRAVLPDTPLVWNEAIGAFDLDSPMIARWLRTLTEYLDAGVPIDGVGIQGHNANKLHDVGKLAALCKALVDLGLDVELTEIDAPIKHFVNAPDPFAAQGDFFERYVSACLDSGGCSGITFWGVSDAVTWYDAIWPMSMAAPNLPLLIDENGRRKPAWLGVRRAFERHAAELGS